MVGVPKHDTCTESALEGEALSEEKKAKWFCSNSPRRVMGPLFHAGLQSCKGEYQACGWRFLGACDPICIYILYIHTSLGIDIHTYTCSVVLYLNNSAHWIKYLLYLLEVH